MKPALDLLKAVLKLKGRYSRRSMGGVSKTKVLSDAVIVAGALVSWAVSEGLVSPEALGKVQGYILMALGAVTYVLRELGPGSIEAVLKEEPKDRVRQSIEEVLADKTKD